MRKPIIGITANELTLENGTERAAAVSTDYVRAIGYSGGVPILLPVVTDKALVQAQLELIDGLLLSGGYDADPLLFGEQPDEKLGYVYPDRDQHEIQLVRAAAYQKMPVLGICRGIQMINIAFGGTLYQDLTAVPGVIKHRQNADNNVPTHTVTVSAKSILAGIFGGKVVVNSFHHQAVKKLAPGFVVTASTVDGVIEAIENPASNFFIGVQWHPEMLIDSQPLMLELFKQFVAAAR